MNTEKKWVFIPVMKENIIKRTPTYVLIDVDGTASGIISAKFLRKKETDDFVFFSIPEDYEINCRVREYDGSKWQVVKEHIVKAVDIKELIVAYNKVCQHKAKVSKTSIEELEQGLPKDDLPFDR